MAGEVSLYSFLFQGEGEWTNSLFYTYLKLAPGADVEDLNALLADFGSRYMETYTRPAGFEVSFDLIPLTDIHLNTTYSHNREAGTDARYLYLFAAVALFILLVACVNFINLSTARASRRAREIGIRKVAGATRSRLIWQFLGESFLMTGLAFCLAMFLTEALIPFVNQLSGKSIDILHLWNVSSVLGLLSLIACVSLISGSYPAFLLSAFKPIASLKGGSQPGGRNQRLRQVLVIFQFSVATVLIIGTLVVASQMNFFQNQKMGFNKEQVVIIPLRDAIRTADESSIDLENVKLQLKNHPGITEASASTGMPGKTMLIDNFPFEIEQNNEILKQNLTVIGGDHDFLKMLGVNMLRGRGFSRELSSDESGAFIINEAAARQFGWEDPVGKKIKVLEGDTKSGEVIGMMENFHIKSLHHEIEPMVLHIWPQRYACLSARIAPGQLNAAMAHIEKVWQSHSPESPFEYSFLDQGFEQYYQSEKQMGMLFRVFAGLAIFISALGLLGLATLITEQRAREVGIRKVLGASGWNITAGFLHQFARLVLIALLIGMPIAFWLTREWLSGFAYHAEIGPMIFVGTAFMTLGVALATVGYHAWKAASTNPAQVLRSE